MVTFRKTRLKEQPDILDNEDTYVFIFSASVHVNANASPLHRKTGDFKDAASSYAVFGGKNFYLG